MSRTSVMKQPCSTRILYSLSLGDSVVNDCVLCVTEKSAKCSPLAQDHHANSFCRSCLYYLNILLGFGFFVLFWTRRALIVVSLFLFLSLSLYCVL